MDVKSSAVETVSSEAKVCLGAYGNRKFEFIAIIGLSGLGLFLYFPEMPFILYSVVFVNIYLFELKKQFTFVNIGFFFVDPGQFGSTHLIHNQIT
jgi:hypothetical protein